MFERTSYQSQLSRFAGAPVIKVLTGMRRVGKSTLLRLFRDQLLSQGIPLDRIIYIDMERFEFASIRNAVDLHGYVTSRRQTPDTTGAVTAPDTHYLFIDEVQEITEWERAVNSLLNEGGFDIYLTGSNANLLSSELATLLTGRYVEMPVYPLSFREFAVFHSAVPDAMLFAEFLKQGGMPGIHHIRGDSETTRQYLSSLADSIILKDIVHRYAIRDIDLLRRIIRFVADNEGNIFSAKKVADFMKKERRTVGVETVYNYLSYIQSAFLAYQVPRFDVKGKRLLEVGEKYYFGDLGLKNALIGYRQSDVNSALESVVFFELKIRGWDVFVGRSGDTEIDFIGQRAGQKIYLQVCYILADQSITQREFAPLESITDNYPKYVLSMDQFPGGDRNGIRRMYLPEFLLADHY